MFYEAGDPGPGRRRGPGARFFQKFLRDSAFSSLPSQPSPMDVRRSAVPSVYAKYWGRDLGSQPAAFHSSLDGATPALSLALMTARLPALAPVWIIFDAEL